MIQIPSRPNSIVDYDTNPIQDKDRVDEHDFNLIWISFQLELIDFNVILIKRSIKFD